MRCTCSCSRISDDRKVFRRTAGAERETIPWMMESYLARPIFWPLERRRRYESGGLRLLPTRAEPAHEISHPRQRQNDAGRLGHFGRARGVAALRKTRKSGLVDPNILWIGR